MSVSLETVLLDAIEQEFHFVFVVDRFRKYIFVGRVTRRTVNEQTFILGVLLGQFAEEIPAAVDDVRTSARGIIQSVAVQ